MKSEVLPRHAEKRLFECLPKVCEYWGVTSEQVLSRSRQRQIIYAKHSLRYFLNTYDDLSSCDIGTLTNCDHSNVIHSVKTFENLCIYDQSFRDFKDIVLEENDRNWEYRTYRDIKKIILSDYYISKKVDLIKKLFKKDEDR